MDRGPESENSGKCSGARHSPSDLSGDTSAGRHHNIHGPWSGLCGGEPDEVQEEQVWPPDAERDRRGHGQQVGRRQVPAQGLESSERERHIQGDSSSETDDEQDNTNKDESMENNSDRAIETSEDDDNRTSENREFCELIGANTENKDQSESDNEESESVEEEIEVSGDSENEEVDGSREETLYEDNSEDEGETPDEVDDVFEDQKLETDEKSVSDKFLQVMQQSGLGVEHESASRLEGNRSELKSPASIQKRKVQQHSGLAGEREPTSRLDESHMELESPAGVWEAEVKQQQTGLEGGRESAQGLEDSSNLLKLVASFPEVDVQQQAGLAAPGLNKISSSVQGEQEQDLRGLEENSEASKRMEEEGKHSSPGAVENMMFLMNDRNNGSTIWCLGTKMKETTDGRKVTIWEEWCKRYVVNFKCTVCGEEIVRQEDAARHVAVKHEDTLIETGMVQKLEVKKTTLLNTMPRRSREQAALRQGREWAGAGRQRTRNRTDVKEREEKEKIVLEPELDFLRELDDVLEDDGELKVEEEDRDKEAIEMNVTHLL